jgi:hypothetical protein
MMNDVRAIIDRRAELEERIKQLEARITDAEEIINCLWQEGEIDYSEDAMKLLLQVNNDTAKEYFAKWKE